MGRMDRAQLSASPEEGPSRPAAVHHPPSAACPFFYRGNPQHSTAGTTAPTHPSGSRTHQAGRPLQLAPDRQPRRPARREVDKPPSLQPMAGKTRPSASFLARHGGHFGRAHGAWQRRGFDRSFLSNPIFFYSSSRAARCLLRMTLVRRLAVRAAKKEESPEERSREEPAAEPSRTDRQNNFMQPQKTHGGPHPSINASGNSMESACGFVADSRVLPSP